MFDNMLIKGLVSVVGGLALAAVKKLLNNQMLECK